ncbi:TraM recognition domain-containing protein [Bythopirellula goksoeyrii]|uniref:TraM recognition domain-containing protein n=1 Tax=Bythopirellula goksoeyrii TaxID=1400387 RepID=UPI00143D720A|nr:TraM recognition domain-containing protein [Bythopirellula goksoeyrii]
MTEKLFDTGHSITLGEWMYDEKEEPELSLQDLWRSDQSPRELGKQGDPVIVSRELLKSGHTHLRGKTGSGKTSRLILPLVANLMKPYTLAWQAKDGEQQSCLERDAIVIVDLGGDKALFNAVKSLAEADPEREFRFLSLDANHSQKFDPFQSIPEDGYRIIRLCNLFLEAFSLDHGLAYGGSWYSQRNLLLMLSICERLVAQKQSGREITLREVDRYLQNPDTQNIRDAEQIRGIFRFLLEYPQLQPGPQDKDVINLKNSIQNRDIIYVFVPSIAEATTARQIAGLVLYSTVNAAMTLYEQRESGEEGNRPQPHVHVFVDEFQQIAGASFEALLTGARKYNLSLYLANQTTESLKTRDLDLSATVRDNCTLKIYQTVTGKQDIEELLTFSRETTRRLKSTKQKESIRVKQRAALGSESESENITTQLSKSEILNISATAGACLAIIEDGKGHREPIPLMTKFLCSEAEYLQFRAQPLPKTSGTSTPSARHGRVLSSMPLWRSQHLEANKSAEHQQRLGRFTQLRERLEAEERGTM